MIYINNHPAGYLLNEGILQFTESALYDPSVRLGRNDILLYCKYLHNHTRFRLMNGDTDFETISMNTNEMGIHEPIVLDENLREVLSHANSYLFLCNTWECFPIFSHKFQDGLAGLLNYLGIPSNKVIVSCCDAHGSSCLRDIRIRAFGFDWAYIREKLNTAGSTFVRPPGHRSKHFIFLNRRYTDDRFLILLFILFKNIQDRFHFSFLSQASPANIRNLYPLMRAVKLFGSDPDQINACIRQGLDLLPVELDGSMNEIDWGSSAGILDKAHDAYFYLMNETMPFCNDSLFISEKTYKPIRLGMPFLVFGGRGTLAHLLDLGFKTFSPFINESYDHETDPVKRLALLMGEVDRLCHLDIKEVKKLHERLMPITEHNLRHIQKPGKVSALEEAIISASCRPVVPGEVSHG